MKQKRLKIIFSNYDDINNPYYRGGGAIALHEVAKRLSKQHEVTVITGNYPRSRNGYVGGVNYRRIGSKQSGPKAGQLIFQFLLPFFVLKETYDIWYEVFTPPFSTGFLPLFTKKPIVGVASFLNAEDKSRQYGLPFYLIENIGINTYKYFVALTSEGKKKILQKNKKALVEIIPHGISFLPTKTRSMNKKEKYILFIGRLEIDQKGIDLLIQAYKQVSGKIRHKLLIAGDGIISDKNFIKSLITKLDLDDKIRMVGRVVDRYKNELFRNAEFIIIPSRYETQGIVALEAITYHKPILCFDIKGLKWLDKSMAIKVKPFLVDKFANEMLKLSQDARLQKKLSKHSKIIAKQFNWENITLKYNRYTQSIIKTNI